MNDGKVYLLVKDKPSGVYRIKTNDKVYMYSTVTNTQHKVTGQTVIKKIKSGEWSFINAQVNLSDGGVYITNSLPTEYTRVPVRYSKTFSISDNSIVNPGQDDKKSGYYRFPDGKHILFYAVFLDKFLVPVYFGGEICDNSDYRFPPDPDKVWFMVVKLFDKVVLTPRTELDFKLSIKGEETNKGLEAWVEVSGFFKGSYFSSSPRPGEKIIFMNNFSEFNGKRRRLFTLADVSKSIFLNSYEQVFY